MKIRRNDEEKIFAVSELFYVEIERWTRNRKEFSDEEKLNEINHLQYIIQHAKEILDNSKDIFDED